MRIRVPRRIPATRLRGRRGAHELDRQVEALLRRMDQPIGGQAIVDHLAHEGIPAPPSQVYRVLRHLLDQGRIKRVETLNAYLAVGDGCDIVLVCTECGQISCAAAPTTIAHLTISARLRGFVPKTMALEVLGVCDACRVAGDPLMPWPDADSATARDEDP